MVTGYAYIRWWWIWKIKARAAWRDFTERGLSLKSGKTSSNPSRPRRRPAEAQEGDLSAAVDRILDKIIVSGFDSLTEDERDILRRHSERTKPH